MKPGQGALKGGRWERETARSLSLWLSQGKHADLLARNVLSGGVFTRVTRQGKQSNIMPGDLMATHPTAFRFLSSVMVECKHLQSLGLEQFLYATSAANPLQKIIDLAEQQARQAGLVYWVVAKQNRRDPLLIMSGELADKLLAPRPRRPVVLNGYHMLHRGVYMVCSFAAFLQSIPPALLLAAAEEVKTP